MNIVFRLAITALLFSIVGSQSAAAGQSQYFNISDPIAAGSKLTYFDLAFAFAPGLAKTPMDGSELARLPHVAPDGYPTTIARPEPGSVERVDFSLGGKPALLLLFDFGHADDAVASVSVLALYDMSAAPRLLDAMDVGLDRDSFFLERAAIGLSPDVVITFVGNAHTNAGEEYLQTSLIGIWNGKLHEVDTISSYSWMTGDKTVQTRPSFTTVKGAVALDATFTVKTTRCDGGCEPDVTYPATTEAITGRYSWDAASRTFVRPAKAFDRVPQANVEE